MCVCVRACVFREFATETSKSKTPKKTQAKKGGDVPPPPREGPDPPPPPPPPAPAPPPPPLAQIDIAPAANVCL